MPNVEGYTVVQVRDDGSTTGSQPVPATDTAKVMGELTPATTVCFAVQSRRGDLASPFTEKVCGETQAAQPTVSPSPTGSGAAPSSPGTSPSQGGGASDGGGGGVVPPPPTTGQSSPSTTGSSSSTQTPTSGSSPGLDTTPDTSFKGKWFAASWWPVVGTSYDPADKLAKLQALDQRAGIVRSGDYKNSVPKFQVDSWVLYLGPFDTPADANAACVTFKKTHPDCQAIQLDP